MKKIIIAILTLFIMQGNLSAKEDNTKTIRLLYPQWQGGKIASLVPELNEKEASQGYYLGAELLNFLAPKTKQKTITIPVSLDYKRIERNGVLDRDIIVNQDKKALKLIKKENPDRIVTLGGDCSVSVIPFLYLSNKYKNSTVVVWIDAHPDITLPKDKTYSGYHAMALSSLMGLGDKKIVKALPDKIDAKNILIVGLRDWEKEEIKTRQKELGLKHLSVDEVKTNSNSIISWIQQTGAKNVLIHFDLDVLDPADMNIAVGKVNNGLKVDETTRIINDIANEFNVVGLTIAEPMPKTAIRIRNMLDRLPLLK